MRLKSLTGFAAGFALLAAPVAASAAPIANPAASLSIAGARAGSPAAHDSRLEGGGTYALVGFLAFVAVVVTVVLVTRDNSKSP